MFALTANNLGLVRKFRHFIVCSVRLSLKFNYQQHVRFILSTTSTTFYVTEFTNAPRITLQKIYVVIWFYREIAKLAPVCLERAFQVHFRVNQIRLQSCTASIWNKKKIKIKQLLHRSGNLPVDQHTTSDGGLWWQWIPLLN